MPGQAEEVRLVLKSKEQYSQRNRNSGLKFVAASLARQMNAEARVRESLSSLPTAFPRARRASSLRNFIIYRITCTLVESFRVRPSATSVSVMIGGDKTYSASYHIIPALHPRNQLV